MRRRHGLEVVGVVALGPISREIVTPEGLTTPEMARLSLSKAEIFPPFAEICRTASVSRSTSRVSAKSRARVEVARRGSPAPIVPVQTSISTPSRTARLPIEGSRMPMLEVVENAAAIGSPSSGGGSPMLSIEGSSEARGPTARPIGPLALCL